ncbi:MAG: coiled-coil domain-containing protein [Bacillota bacterium]
MLRLKIRDFLIIPLLTVFFTYLIFPPLFAAPNDEQDRLQLRQSISRLESDANALAQELLVLDLKGKKAEQEKEVLKREIADTKEKKNVAEFEYNTALNNKNETLKKLKPWINFQYRFGYWTLVESILGSSSLYDFINRTMMMSFILGQQVKDYRTAEEACEVSLQKEKALKETIDRLTGQNALLELQIQEIRKLSEYRREYLEEIQRTSSNLAKKVVAIESNLLYSLNLYQFLTGAIAKFPWNDINPDNISFNFEGVVIEMSEKNLNNTLQSSGDEDLKRLSVELSEGVFTLSGIDTKAPSKFSLGGVLVPDSQSSAVRLDPRTLSLNDIPVTKDVLDQLASSSVFQMPIPEDMLSFKVSRIDITDENFIIVLKR